MVCSSVSASASSKVLISGAYLIIDPKNEGIVLSTDAKFQCDITATSINWIRVKSPQFRLDLCYEQDSYRPGQNFTFKPQGNEFIDKMMFFLTLCLLDKQPKRISNMFDIMLRGDNSFYSQRNCRGGFFPDRLNMQPRFSVPTDPS